MKFEAREFSRTPQRVVRSKHLIYRRTFMVATGMVLRCGVNCKGIPQGAFKTPPRGLVLGKRDETGSTDRRCNWQIDCIA